MTRFKDRTTSNFNFNSLTLVISSFYRNIRSLSQQNLGISNKKIHHHLIFFPSLGWLFYLIFTRNRCAQRYKSDCINGVFQVNEAAKMACNITDYGSTDTNHRNGNEEARITSSQSYQNVSSKKQGQYFFSFSLLFTIL